MESSQQIVIERDANVSRDRAQDWISSVLNPMIDSLRRELTTPKGPWRWYHTNRRFELLRPLSQTVSALYVDNLDDFLERCPPVRPIIDEHDAAVLALEESIGRVFDRLVADDALMTAVRAKAAQPSASDDADRDARWFASWVAAGYERVSEDVKSHPIVNDPTLRTHAADVAKDEIKARADAAQRLEVRARAALDTLVDVRKQLVNAYQARVRPVDV